MEEFRVDVHERFDGVHEHLDQVVKQLERGFNLLSEDIAAVRRDLENVQERLRNLGETVDQVARGLTYAYVNLRAEHERLRNLITGPKIIECTGADISSESNPDADRAYGRNVDIDFLTHCRSNFQVFANDVERDQVAVEEIFEDNDNFVLDLVVHPDQTVDASLEEFKRYLESAGRMSGGLPRSVVGPEAWFDVMIKQNKFRTLFLNAAERLEIGLTSDAFKSVMSDHRSDLRDFLEGVEEELRVFTGIDEPRKTVFSALFGGVRARLGRLRDLIGSIQDDYYADDSLFDGRTRPAEVEGAVIPEIRYEDHPRAWNRMADFDSPADRFPKWLRFVDAQECVAALREQPYDSDSTYSYLRRFGDWPWGFGRMDDHWFEGNGILQFLHGNDLMPVRLDMGNIDVCGVESGNWDFWSGDFQTDAYALAIWYTPSADTECPRTLLLHEVARLESEAYPWSLASLMLNIERRVRGRGPVLIGRENASSEASVCVEGLYDERFEAKRRALSDYVRSRLEDDAEFAEIARALRIAHLHLRSWLALALDDARWRSETVEEVLSRTAAFPDLTELIGAQEQGYAWDVVEDGLGRVERIEELMSSRRMRDAVLYGTGHRYLTEARFVVLDDGPADEIGLASR